MFRMPRITQGTGQGLSTTMVITTILAYFVSRDLLGWSRLTAGAVTAAFLVVDVAFFGANLFKIADGGWFPLVIAAVVFTLMTTWRRGRQILNQKMREGSLTSERFLESLRKHAPVRVPGTSVFLSHLSGHIPDSLLLSLKHYKVLHEQVLILTVVTDEVSRVDESGRVRPSGMAMWRERVFASMMRNATSTSNFFGLPPNRVVELGAQTEL